MYGLTPNFRDAISGKMVYNAVCRCQKIWMTDSTNPWFGFRVERTEVIWETK